MEPAGGDNPPCWQRGAEEEGGRVLGLLHRCTRSVLRGMQSRIRVCRWLRPCLSEGCRHGTKCNPRSCDRQLSRLSTRNLEESYLHNAAPSSGAGEGSEEPEKTHHPVTPPRCLCPAADLNKCRLRCKAHRHQCCVANNCVQCPNTPKG